MDNTLCRPSVEIESRKVNDLQRERLKGLQHMSHSPAVEIGLRPIGEHQDWQKYVSRTHEPSCKP